MKTIGMIGGTSYESTITYYDVINKEVNRMLGGQHCAKCILYSVDFDGIERGIVAGEWAGIAATLADAAITLERAGADFIVLCTNTLHKVAPKLERAVRIPFLHIAEVTADALGEAGIKTVGLLGTKPTMVDDFYKERLRARGIEPLIPSAGDIERVNAVIFDELCHGIARPEARRDYLRVIDELRGRGAEGVILGCTEIGLLIRQADTPVPLFDTALLHAARAAAFAVKPV